MAKHTLVVMFEYGYFPPLWADGGDDGATIDVQSRDTWHWLADGLWDRLMQWAHYGDTLLPDEWPEGAFQEWNDQGRRLATEIRSALPNDDFDVLYHDEVLERTVPIERTT